MSDIRLALITKHREAARRQLSPLRADRGGEAEAIAKRAMRELRTEFRTLPRLLRDVASLDREVENLREHPFDSLRDIASEQGHGPGWDSRQDRFANMTAGLSV
jgi:hypothetical protein